MNLDKFVKTKWYVQGFNATPNPIIIGALSGFRGMWERLGFGYTSMINSFKDDYCEFYYCWDDLVSIAQNILQRLSQDKDYLSNLMREEEEQRKEQLKMHQKAWKTDLKKLSIPQLIQLYQEQYAAYLKPASISHILESFIFIDELLQKKLHEYYEKSKPTIRFNYYLTALNQPIRPSFIQQEQDSLLKILTVITAKNKLRKEVESEKVTNIELKSLIKEHQEKYFWIRSNYAHGLPLQEQDFLKELKKMMEEKVNPHTVLRSGASIYTNNRREKKKRIKELGINDQKTLLFLELSEIGLHWLDDRKKMLLMGLTTFTPILYEIGLRFNLEERLMLYLHPEEIRKDRLEKATNQELRERKKGCTFLWKLTEVQRKEGRGPKDKMVLLTGDDYIAFQKKIIQKENEEITDLHGTCASIGSASGKVRICKTKEDIEHFKEGEVLVSSMTRPEFVPAMKKAAAIITDEGGITCHAAIISRELRLPCVIGTKIATKVLKDGDDVEVKADHGLVRIKKRKE